MSTDLATTVRPTTSAPAGAAAVDTAPGRALPWRPVRAVRPVRPVRPEVTLRSGDGRDPRDADAVRRIFRATLVVGRAAPVALRQGPLAAYERLCLDWYLEHGSLVLAERDGEVVGYLLACLDEAAHQRWLRRAALRWLASSAMAAVSGQLEGDAKRFVRARVRDGWHTWRHAPAPPVPAHAHVNLVRHVRAGRTGRDLAHAMDELVRAAGLPGWYAEMNVPPGRSLAAIRHAGAAVVHRQPSHTFTRLLGVPVERVTLARLVATPPARSWDRR